MPPISQNLQSEIIKSIPALANIYQEMLHKNIYFYRPASQNKQKVQEPEPRIIYVDNTSFAEGGMGTLHYKNLSVKYHRDRHYPYELRFFCDSDAVLYEVKLSCNEITGVLKSDSVQYRKLAVASKAVKISQVEENRKIQKLNEETKAEVQANHATHEKKTHLLKFSQPQQPHAIEMRFIKGVPLNRYLLSQLGDKDSSQKDSILLHIFKQMFEQILEMHNTGWVHFDIKPENFMYDEETGVLTLIDKGLATKVKESTVIKGTPIYFHPALYKAFFSRQNEIKAKFEFDWCSFGIILYAFLKDLAPESKKLIESILQYIFPFGKEYISFLYDCVLSNKRAIDISNKSFLLLCQDNQWESKITECVNVKTVEELFQKIDAQIKIAPLNFRKEPDKGDYETLEWRSDSDTTVKLRPLSEKQKELINKNDTDFCDLGQADAGSGTRSVQEKEMDCSRQPLEKPFSATDLFRVANAIVKCGGGLLILLSLPLMLTGVGGGLVFAAGLSIATVGLKPLGMFVDGSLQKMEAPTSQFLAS